MVLGVVKRRQNGVGWRQNGVLAGVETALCLRRWEDQARLLFRLADSVSRGSADATLPLGSISLSGERNQRDDM